MKKLLSIGNTCIAILLVAGCQGKAGKDNSTADVKSVSSAKVTLIGAGASFPAPLLTAWADDYRELTKGRVTVNYQSIGSGGGVRQFMEKTIMFGATEAALNDENMKAVAEAGGGVAFNIPLTLGDVVLTYNLPGIEKGLVFDAAVVAGAFLGQITHWNDPRIAALNPGIQLPAMPINIVHRADGSGTTAVFTDYLCKISAEWASKVGTGSSVNWPVGTGGNGNEGVAGVVQSTSGALGYNSLVYAVLNNIAYGKMVNKAGKVIEPSLAATSLAAEVELPEDGRVSLTDTAAVDGYPITGFSWALVYQNLEHNGAIKSKSEAIELVRFLYYMVSEGQKTNESLSFAPLPAKAQALAKKMIASLQYAGEPVGQQLVAQIEKTAFRSRRWLKNPWVEPQNCTGRYLPGIGVRETEYSRASS